MLQMAAEPRRDLHDPVDAVPHPGPNRLTGPLRGVVESPGAPAEPDAADQLSNEEVLLGRQTGRPLDVVVLVGLGQLLLQVVRRDL
jgi:hypothetical protein